MPSIPCPKCTRILPQSGVADCDGESFAVYQCDECLVPVDLGGGEMFDAALTFCIGKDGKPFDPASPDSRLPL